MQAALQQNGRAIVIAAGGKVFQARRGQHRGIRPGVRGNVRDIGIVRVSAVLLVKLESRIERTDQRLERREAR